jgi:uncharacterized protein with HEPN domain
MSDRAWKFYLDDMLHFANKVKKYTLGMDRAGFEEDELKYDAILRNLELIGEAATRLPSDVRSRYTDIPWRQVIATRNRLIHGYLGIDNDTLWSIVEDDIDPLILGLRAILDSLMER